MHIYVYDYFFIPFTEGYPPLEFNNFTDTKQHYNKYNLMVKLNHLRFSYAPS